MSNGDILLSHEQGISASACFFSFKNLQDSLAGSSVAMQGYQTAYNLRIIGDGDGVQASSWIDRLGDTGTIPYRFTAG
jgi:hypothetical protein